MTLEQLLFLALIALVVLFNALIGVLRSRARRPRPPDLLRPHEPREIPAPAPPLRPRRAAVPRARITEPVRPEEPRRRRGRRLRPRDARDAVVLMTILGRCRGLERMATPGGGESPPP